MALSVGANKVSTVFPRLSSPPFKAAEMRGSFSTTEASLDRPGRVLMISAEREKMLDHRASDVILSEQRPRLQEKKKE